MRWYQYILLIFLLFMLQRPALAFNSGSDGSFGPVDTSFGFTRTIDLPPDGIIHATTINIARGSTLKFNRNALNTPVYLLATGDIIIDGNIDVSAGAGPGGGTSIAGGPGGPGGFDGGQPGVTPGAGYGPGAGQGGSIDDLSFTGNAGHRTPGGINPSDGQAYGSDLLMPIIGGSGGGAVSGLDTAGNPAVCGGTGGGGAIVIASDTSITMGNRASISAAAGSRSCPISITRAAGLGSAGAIRLVAPVISGTNVIFSVNASVNNAVKGKGRVRIDAIDRKQLIVDTANSGPVIFGTFMQVFPPIIPHLDIVDVAGQPIAVGTATPVDVTLPFNALPTQTVTVQATDFTGIVPIRVVFTPDSGVPVIVDGQIDMSTGNPASTTLTVDLPQNVLMRVNAWTL